MEPDRQVEAQACFRWRAVRTAALYVVLAVAVAVLTHQAFDGFSGDGIVGSAVPGLFVGAACGLGNYVGARRRRNAVAGK